MPESHIIAALRRNTQSIALESEVQSFTYAEVLAEVEALSEIVKGQQAVAIHMKNSPAWVIADLACLMAGTPCVPLPPFFTDEQNSHVLSDAGVSLLLTDQPGKFNGPGMAIMIGGQTAYAVGQFYLPANLPAHTAKITYTSGTTGHPKGVCLTQEAVETVATSLLNMIGKDVAARHLSVLPLAVLLENVAGVYTVLLAGATCCLRDVPSEPLPLARALMETRATSCIFVPELLRMLLSTRQTLPYLDFVAVGGARVDPHLLEQAHMQGIPAYEGYGISENSSVLTLNTPSAFKHGTAGKPLPHVELKIEKGEIFIKHPLFSGYLGEAHRHQEWYATGDLGEIDEEGFLHIHGRKRNLFITSYGRNVSPEWPESLLTAHPAIAQAVLFGEARPFAVAVIVPYAPEHIGAAVSEANRRLPDYARIGAYVIAHEAFSPSNHQLTGNGRLQREAIFAAYEADIERCYPKEKRA